MEASYNTHTQYIRKTFSPFWCDTKKCSKKGITGRNEKKSPNTPSCGYKKYTNKKGGGEGGSLLLLVVGKNEKTSSTDELRNENYKLIKMGADVGGIAGYAGGECTYPSLNSRFLFGGAGEVLA